MERELPGRLPARQSCQKRSSGLAQGEQLPKITGTQVLSLRARMPLFEPERVGPAALFWEVFCTAHSQNCTLDRCFSVCSIKKFPGNGKFGVCVSCFYCTSAEMSPGQSRADCPVPHKDNGSPCPRGPSYSASFQCFSHGCSCLCPLCPFLVSG